MAKVDKNHLKYRRQYLIAPGPVACPFVHSEWSLPDASILYTHTDLPVSRHSEGEITIVIIGDMFDYRNPGKSNKEIAIDLVDTDLYGFLKKTDAYTGRFVIIYGQKDQLFLVNDATTTRKVFYTRKEEKLWMASTSHLLARMAGSTPTENESIQRYHRSEDFVRLDYANIGDTTFYKGMKQLTPNHFLRVEDGTVTRFWPNSRIDHRPLHDVAAECAVILKGHMEAIVKRYEVMLPVTAGNDTRLLLSVTRDFSDKIYYYINKEFTLTDDATDIKIPVKLFKKLGLDYHVVEIPSKIDDEFWEIYFENNPLATPKYLPHIFNYHKNFPDKVNLPGNFASAPWGLNRLAEKNVDARALANSYRFNAYEHAVEYFEKWLKGCHQLCRDSNIELMRLFYWEERIGNWGTQTQLDKDIAQEDINPLNSRILLIKFLEVEKKYNNVPDYLLHRAIIRQVWPELLSVPINPSRINTVLRIAKALGVLKLIFLAKFKTAR